MMSFLRSVATIPRAASATPTESSLHSFSSTKPQTFPFPSSHRSLPRLRWGYKRIFASSPMACVPQATAVSEFKGPAIFGKHSWCINEYGDLTKGAASTGNIYNPLQDDETATQLPGDLGTLEADQNGEALYTVKKEKMKVTDLIGRAVVVYETEDMSLQGITAAVVARSGEVGESCRKLCSCDGTTVWEATVY
ncbi:copper chaperone for superoxide dismutase, chloroplastic/cytosolic isoform X4 [Brassica napus]|uniref:copper chaperone for superoxide dismutase, chloroplastic/cytosolic isoform X4 n=1 Tax=Brassica napus TaxID=3708 RepID=UPI000BBE3F26|nr:copper chaperone for superoxide dismutase, chloroplastic/cytosolic isoform X4 [Brassica napus]